MRAYHYTPHIRPRGEEKIAIQHGFKARRWIVEVVHSWFNFIYIKKKKNQVDNTPTGVGKTSFPFLRYNIPQKHPHKRGEDDSPLSYWASAMETPPRAWGRRKTSFVNTFFFRNTPTGVGKTSSTRQEWKSTEKHPHGRGEDYAAKNHVSLEGGNTPTGVGKTVIIGLVQIRAKKHPHGRGEDIAHRDMINNHTETPPRAWGRHIYTFL